MNVIVFGGAGFVGSHVADALSEAGYVVTIFDKRPSLYLRDGQKMIVGDMMDKALLSRALEGQKLIFNFAGYADVESSRDFPIETVQNNILVNALLLDTIKGNDIERYVFASTMYVYSRFGTFYRVSKQACEGYIETFNEIHGIPYTILRFGSLYGPRADENNGIQFLIRSAMKDGCISYWGSGEEIREYIHVQDAARSVIDALKPEFKNRCLLLTGTQPMKVKDLIAMIQEIMGKKLDVVFKAQDRIPLRGAHYHSTPYSYDPKIALKIVRTEFVDLGQGLLGLIEDLGSLR